MTPLRMTGGGSFSPAIDSRLRALLQSLPIPDGAFASVIGKFEVLRELESIGGTGIFAQAAEHAAAQVIGKGGELFSACIWIAFAAHHNQMFGTCQRAQVARNTKGFVGIGINVKPRRATVAFGNLGPFQGVLLRIDLVWILVAEGDREALEQVYEENSPQKLRNSGAHVISLAFWAREKAARPAFTSPTVVPGTQFERRFT